MTISFPLALPKTPSSIVFCGDSQTGESESPFSFSQQTYEWPADRWLATLSWSILNRVNADDVEGFILSLRGRVGSFLMGDPLRTSARGTWLGQSPLVNGASQTGFTLAIDGLTPTTTTGIKGDYFQLGTGATSRLYRLTAPFTANGSGQATLDFWPRLREIPADNAALTLSSARGLFKLNTNRRSWTIQDDLDSDISIDCIEDLRGL